MNSLTHVSVIVDIARCEEKLKTNTDSSILILACEDMKEKSVICVLDMLKNVKKQLVLDKQNNDGYTALLVACKNKMCDVVSSLLYNYPDDCNINAKNKYNENALILASRNGFKRNTISKILNISDKSGWGIVDSASITPIIYLCTHKKTRLVLKMLETPSICNLSHATPSGETVAYFAMKQHMTEVVLKLLEYHDICKIYEQTIDGLTPLMWACVNNFTEICMILLKYPEKCRLSEIGHFGETALIFACKNKKHNMARKILKSNIECLPDIKDDNGSTALMYAASNKLSSVVTWLLKAYPDRCNMGAKNTYGSTALMLACAVKNEYIALRLLDYPDKCNMAAQNKDGSTALHTAIRNAHTTIIKKILQYPDKCGLNLQDVDGYTPLYESVMKCNIDAFRLITSPSNISMCNLGALIRTKSTVLLFLCRSVRAGKEFNNLILDILNYPDMCNLGVCDCNNMTALMYACRYSSTDIALKMLNYPDKCNLDMQHPVEGSAFNIALTSDRMDIVDKIMPHINVINHIPLSVKCKNIINKYIDICVVQRLETIPNSAEIKENMKKLENYRDHLHNNSQSRNCVMCFEDTCNNSMFVNCKHVISICVECTQLVSDKCPVCSQKTSIISGVFVV
jgi:ankyrin repeat protein